jgi:hypothetical protein
MVSSMPINRAGARPNLSEINGYSGPVADRDPFKPVMPSGVVTLFVVDVALANGSTTKDADES